MDGQEHQYCEDKEAQWNSGWNSCQEQEVPFQN